MPSVQSLFSLVITVSRSLKQPRKIFTLRCLEHCWILRKDDLTVCTRGVFSHRLIRRQNRHKGGFTCPATGLMALSESHTFLETWE